MKYCRLEQGKKRKSPVHHLWQRAPQRANKPKDRCLRKPWERSQRPFNQQLGRVGPSAIHLRRQWQKARCARRAASSGASLFAESWEEFSVAAAPADDRLPVATALWAVSELRTARKHRRAPGTRRDC